MADLPRIFPVRHHSPAAALLVERLVRELRPSLVLVEGPVDANPLLDVLLDPETVPPIALYAYRTGEGAASLYYPFCAYSPEYVALRVGREIGAVIGFCDLPAATMLHEPSHAARLVDGLLQDSPPDHRKALAAAAGFDDFETFWETVFEQDAAADTPAAFAAALGVYGHELRALDSADELAWNERRERHMAAVAREAIARGHLPARTLVVCGAFHVAGIAAAFGDAAPPEAMSAPPAEVVLIPYSYPRLSEQSGYGAGNRAPWYYQRVWEHGGDFGAATRYALLDTMHRLRAGEHLASLAQAIDAETLAHQLTGLRGKRAPGFEELVDSAVSCFGFGRPDVVNAPLTRVLVGDQAGRLTSRVGRTPLQAEFYAATQALGLPVRDAPSDVLVHLTQPREAQQSVLLHRLVVAGIPYGRQVESGIGGGGRDVRADALQQIGRVLEKWQVHWTPSTDALLIERNAWGTSLAEVASRLLLERLGEATRVDEGSDVLLRLALCALPEPFDTALDRCELLAGDSASFSALARATYHLDGLLAYGSARSLPLERLRRLAHRLFARAVVHLPGAAACDDEGAREFGERMRALHELVERGAPSIEHVEPYWSALERVASQHESHPSVRGLALLLLELGSRLSEGELARRLRFWLGSGDQPAASAQLVAALFSLHRATLLRNREVVSAVSAFLLDLEMSKFVAILPTLRATLGTLSSRERDELSETLAVLLGLSADDAASALDLSGATHAILHEAAAAVAATVETWKVRYGIA